VKRDEPEFLVLPARAREVLRIARRFLAPILTAVAVGYVAWIVVSDSEEFIRAVKATSPMDIGLAALAFIGSNSLLALQWVKLLEGLDPEVKRRSGLWCVYGQSWLARYVPGRIAGPMTLVVGAQHLGYPPRLLVVSLGYQAALQVPTSVAFGALLMLIFHQAASRIFLLLKLALLTALIILGVVIAAPRLLPWVFQNPPSRLPMRTTMAVISLQMCANSLGGLAVAILASRASGLDAMLYIAAAEIISAVFGTLLAIAPAGIGVREGLLTFLLSSEIGSTAGLSVAVLSRVLRILSDVAFSGTCFLLDRPRPHDKS